MTDISRQGDAPTGEQASEMEQQAASQRTGIRILVATGIVIGALMLVSLVLAYFSLMSCVSSCTRQISDPPISESPKTESFLSDTKANDDDLRVFDAIHPAIEDEIGKEAAEAIRKSVASGEWSIGSGIRRNASPLLWVRICELAEKDMGEKTGEGWHATDIDYPFPTNHTPIPAIPHRDEDSCVTVTLTCASGSCEGLQVEDRYYRWADPPRFEDDYDEAVTGRGQDGTNPDAEDGGDAEES